MIPHAIIHINKKETDGFDLLLSCKRAIHLSKNELALLKIYAESSSGFRPAQQYLADQTGMCRRQVPRCRENLVKHGLCIMTDSALYLDWSRLRLFSTLDPKMTRGKRNIIAPVLLGSDSTMLDSIKRKHKTIGLSMMDPQELASMMDKLKETEYQSLVKLIRR